jgi:biotin carboxylase
MKRFLIVGKSFGNLQRKILERGDDYVLLQDEALPEVLQSKDERVFNSDFSSQASLIKALSRIDSQIDGATAMYENYIVPTAWITHELGLPGMPIASAKACSDKLRMRELFGKSPEKISPDFHIIESEQDLLTFIRDHKFPVMLKPANLVKSLLVTKNHNKQELLKNYAKMLREIPRVYQTYAPHHQPKILIEEFMHGSTHSVDAFVDGKGIAHVLEAVVDYETGYDIGYADNFHYSRHLPSELSPAQTEAIRHVAMIGCQALGMKNSPAHVEIIFTTDGPQIVEIGARNGGYRERMHRLSNGIDIFGATLDTALGQAVSIRPTKNEPCSVLELFPKKPGVFAKITNEDKLKQLPSLQYLSIKVKPGAFVGSSSDGYKMCAVIILHNADEAQFARDLAFVNTSVHVSTKST